MEIYHCPKCKKKTEHRIRTRIGRTDRVRYTYYHLNNEDGLLSLCDLMTEEPISDESIERE